MTNEHLATVENRTTRHDLALHQRAVSAGLRDKRDLDYEPLRQRRNLPFVPASEAQIHTAIQAVATAFKSPARQSLTAAIAERSCIDLPNCCAATLKYSQPWKPSTPGFPSERRGWRSHVGSAFGILCRLCRQDRGHLPRSWATIQLRPTGAVWRDRPDRSVEHAAQADGARLRRCCRLRKRHVVKPSVVAPLIVLIFGKTVDEAGFPPGSVNIITGSGRTVGKAIVDLPHVRKIIFTGGTEGGHEVLQQAVRTVTPAGSSLAARDPSSFVKMSTGTRPSMASDPSVRAQSGGVFCRTPSLCPPACMTNPSWPLPRRHLKSRWGIHWTIAPSSGR